MRKLITWRIDNVLGQTRISLYLEDKAPNLTNCINTPYSINLFYMHCRCRANLYLANGEVDCNASNSIMTVLTCH